VSEKKGEEGAGGREFKIEKKKAKWCTFHFTLNGIFCNVSIFDKPSKITI
jgi:hypothetical protein